MPSNRSVYPHLTLGTAEGQVWLERLERGNLRPLIASASSTGIESLPLVGRVLRWGGTGVTTVSIKCSQGRAALTHIPVASVLR